ncbi:hypothetical protein, partial [Hymenobacter coccineus]|uniref:hypothetical protein n=1 Tax=Hymenobacter coccineus TaxID=1908235 RepID=UPI001955DB8A
LPYASFPPFCARGAGRGAAGYRLPPGPAARRRARGPGDTALCPGPCTRAPAPPGAGFLGPGGAPGPWRP